MRRPPTYHEYKSASVEMNGADLAHYYNNEFVSVSSIAELLKLKISKSTLTKAQKRDLEESVEQMMNGLASIHQIANDAFTEMDKETRS